MTNSCHKVGSLSCVFWTVCSTGCLLQDWRTGLVCFSSAQWDLSFSCVVLPPPPPRKLSSRQGWDAELATENLPLTFPKLSANFPDKVQSQNSIVFSMCRNPAIFPDWKKCYQNFRVGIVVELMHHRSKDTFGLDPMWTSVWKSNGQPIEPRFWISVLTDLNLIKSRRSRQQRKQERNKIKDPAMSTFKCLCRYLMPKSHCA